MRFFADVEMGSKRGWTPEKYLVVMDVPIARTGVQLYSAGEVSGATAGRDGLIMAERHEDDVFRPETLASFEGKPVTDDHPTVMLDPSNARSHMVGVTINPRRGTGDYRDCILADVMLYDPATIAKVQAGKVQVSCGYDADYQQIGPGRVRQKNIIGNHVAVVDRARCGALCSFGDSAMAATLTTPAAPAPRKGFSDSVKRALRKAFYTQDEDAMETAMENAGDDEDGGDSESDGAEVHHHVNVTIEGANVEKKDDEDPDDTEESEATTDKVMDALGKVLARLDAIEAKGAAPAPKVKAAVADAAAPGVTVEAAAVEMREARSRAEILHPGVKLPTLDAAASPKATMDAACALRRKTLLLASESDRAGPIVQAILGTRALDGMPCADAKQVFDTAALLMAEKNRMAGIATIGHGVQDKGIDTATAIPSRSNRDTNIANKARWAKKPGAPK